MADHSSINTCESQPFSAMYRLQTPGQRSTYSLLQNNPLNKINQYEDNSLLNNPAENGTNAGTNMNGVGEHINTAYWDMESLISSQPGVLNRSKAHREIYEEEWNSSSQQKDTMENYGSTEGNHQKLDSFSEAFYSRNISRIVDQVGYNADPNNSPSLPFLSFPLVLSPPPTPLPQPSLSPPKRALYPPVAQSVSQTQSQTPSEASLRFFAPFSCTSSILPGGYTHSSWGLPLSTETSGSEDLTQHLSQDPGSSAVYPEGMGIHLRDLNATDGDADCSLEAPPCSPLVQPLPSQAVPKLEREHCPVTSDHHMTWSQMMLSSQPFCSSSHHLNDQIEGLGVHEDTKSSTGFQQTPFLCLSSSQNNPSAVYTGVPFYSVLQSGALGENWREHVPRHSTPQPMLNPSRSGTGLYCNLLPPLNHQDQWSEETEHCARQPQINVGPEFQAEIPALLKQEELWSQEPLKEELLWKPWAELEGNDDLLEQVENLLDLSTSTALPGGVANLELALHSLSSCRGNILAALEMMFFSNSKPSRNYHYSGSDIWRLSEQKLFQKAYAMCGKDFTFIQKMVKSKGVSQCVEFYYHSKRLRDKQRKLKEKEAQQQQMAAETLTPTSQVMVMNPVTVDRLIPTPALVPSFPCKQCGKMFYKIKSRNAHMKIHRQQQEDWRDRMHSNNHLSLTHALQNQNRILTNPNQLVTKGHPNQLLTHSLIQSLVQSQTQFAFIQSSKTQNPCFTSATNNTHCTQTPQMAPKAPVLPHCRGHQQAWGAIHGSLESGLYYD